MSYDAFDQFEWDSDKERTNISKHGVAFDEAKCIFTSGFPFVLIKDTRYDYGEDRIIAIGCLIEDLVLVVVYTDRVRKKRLISARKANGRERRKYNELVQKEIEGA